MTSRTVTWRQTTAAVAAVVIGLLAFMVVFDSEGLPAVDATSSRSTRWFVHRPTGTIVLADGYGGRALASVDVEAEGEQIAVAEGAPAAYVLNDNTAEVRPIETAELRFGASIGLAALGGGQAISTVGPGGLTVLNPLSGQATSLPLAGEPLSFEAPTGEATVVAPDGVIWTIDGSTLRRVNSRRMLEEDLGLGAGALLTRVGNEPFVVDPVNRRARLGDGAWQSLDTNADPSEIVVQREGPSAECGWVGADDDLWCVSQDAVAERATIDGLDISGSDHLAIAGDAGVVVRRGPASIVRIDWRGGRILDDVALSVDPDEVLDVISTVDLVWVDEVDGDQLYAVNPWDVNVIDKNAADTFVVGDDGELVDDGGTTDDPSVSDDELEADDLEYREPDDNGIDDPPVALDDAVTARSGSSVSIQVTANDFDPDGEAVAVDVVGVPGHGNVEIATASTVVYTPDAGYVGTDVFDYTIVDGDGTEAGATVVVELLPPTATNQPPIGRDDEAQTGPDRPVVIDVLLNDLDPERDALRIGSFTPADSADESTIGTVTETRGPSGLPALRFEPAPGFEGSALFSYRPVDALGGQGDDVDVRVEVADLTTANRPPVARPDSVRLRRNVPTPLTVLVNDVDPDGDNLTLSVVAPLPEGLEVSVEGNQLSVTARAGARDLLPFQYEIADGRGGIARGAVLVAVIDDEAPNLPPVLGPDFDTVVVGSSVTIEVLDNDIDPDSDPLVVTGVTAPADGLGQAVVVGNRVQFTPSSIGEREETTARFTYTVSDGNGHVVTGDVAVTVLSEAQARPPYARDDSTFTTVDSPVTVDVLRNDGDPSGERPTIVGTPGCPTGGRAVVTADGQVRYDPPAGQIGAFRCTYEVTNSRGLRASASIVVSVRAKALTNQSPVTTNDNLTLEVGATGSVDVTANDTDPDGDSSLLTVVSSTSPTLGTATRRGNIVSFTAGRTTGVSTITYQVSDADGAVSLGRLVVVVTERVNQPPIAAADRRTIVGPGTATQFDVLANDVDPDGPSSSLTVESVAPVSGNGSVLLSGRIVTITPTPDFVGDVVANYTISDRDGLTSTAQVILTVLEIPNRPPVAGDDGAEVANGGTVTAAVLFNDLDPDGDPLSLEIVSGADTSLGSARVTLDNAISFTAVPGAAGIASIGYRISDGELTDDAVLQVSVRPCSESPPLAADGFLRTGYRQPIAVDLATFGVNGAIVDVVGPPEYVNGVYTPPAGENGNISIGYAVVNGCRQRATGTVTIDVNQDPVARPQSMTVGRGDVREVPVVNIATDAEPLTIVSSDGAPGWVTTEAGRLVIAPPASASLGEVTWRTIVRDPGGLSTAVSFTVTVANRPPVGIADTVDASAGSPVTAAVLDNDTDPDGPNSELRLVSVSTSVLAFPNGGTGTVMILDGRQLAIDPGTGDGTATFTYTMSDQVTTSERVTVTVVGPALNTPPFANDQVVTVDTGVPVSIALDAGDTGAAAVTLIDLVDESGIVTSQAGLSLTVIAPAPGTFFVTYRVTDGELTSRTATLRVDAT